jgi:hypothetical protein
VAPFLIKLFEIVSSPASDNLVCWSEHGESFRIVDRTKFAQVKVPQLARQATAQRIRLLLTHGRHATARKTVTDTRHTRATRAHLLRMCYLCTSNTTTSAPSFAS